MIRTASILSLLAVALLVVMTLWPNRYTIAACMFVGQGALLVSIAMFGEAVRRHRRGRTQANASSDPDSDGWVQ